MTFSDIEKLVLRANRLYKSTQDKLNYVNIRTNSLDRYLQPIIVGKKYINSYVPHAKFYRILAAVKDKLGERVEESARGELEDLVDMKDSYQVMLDDTEREIEIELAKDNLELVLKLRKFYFDYSVYLSAIREEISNMHDEGALRPEPKTELNPQAISI